MVKYNKQGINSASNRGKLTLYAGNKGSHIVETVDTVDTQQVDYTQSKARPDYVTDNRPDMPVNNSKKGILKKQGITRSDYTDTLNAVCYSYNGLWYEYVPERVPYTYFDTDIKALKQVTVMACKYLRGKGNGIVSISGVVKALKAQGITIINYKLVSKIVKLYLVKYPNIIERNDNKRYNPISHNKPEAQECPIITGNFAPTVEFMRKALYYTL